ncbi:hypothetical protein CEXT_636191 [Caerostris extrusa]|uniref:Uncharacterized protein n=1 Tax=Caerostris extrusa TaxID=172846 RepID=A0AAV4T5K7_CAEEX|nr:hypothetical protein CEXT_636191 [Caerostris extrusa]
MSGFRFFYKTVQNSKELPALSSEIGSLTTMTQPNSLESPALRLLGRGGVHFPSDGAFFIRCPFWRASFYSFMFLQRSNNSLIASL